MRTVVSRPEPGRLPSLPLPVYVRSVGYNEAAAGWSENLPGAEKPFVQLFWGVRGAGELLIDGRKRTLRENETIYHLPLEDHAHVALGPLWTYRWFTLDGPGAADFMRGYGYPREAQYAGECPHELFLAMEQLMKEMSPYSQRKLLSVATDILALAGGRPDETTRAGQVVGRFIELTRGSYMDDALNVNAVADRMGIHRTTLTRLFQQKMMMSPGEYLARQRIQCALSLLRESELSIAEVARRAGIPHRSYFSRAIRRATGVSPREYRERGDPG